MSVNMTPSDVPQDMYSIVANRIKDKFAEMEDLIDIEFAILWSQFGFDRALTKRQCMTKSYGSTLHSCTEYTRQYVQDRIDAGDTDVFGEFRGQATLWMSKLIWNTINEVVQGPQETMEWLQAVSRAYTAAGLPMEWETPSGFVVHHYYPEWKSRQVKTFIDGKEVKPRIREEQEGSISSYEVANGISANLIHSLDASHLVATVNRMAERGITDMVTIHDSFGVHACHVGVLYETLRETFIELYEEYDPINGLVKRAIKDGIQIPIPPLKGSYEVSEVSDSVYFFT
jgi:DNA-directed RNA polymerase